MLFDCLVDAVHVSMLPAVAASDICPPCSLNGVSINCRCTAVAFQYVAYDIEGAPVELLWVAAILK